MGQVGFYIINFNSYDLYISNEADWHQFEWFKFGFSPCAILLGVRICSLSR